MVIELGKKSTKRKYLDIVKGQMIDCIRCEFTFYKYETSIGKRIFKTRKGWLCEDCIDPDDE